jgi:hypothetical protein
MPKLPLSVYVGTQKATVLYRGRSVFTGEDQINFVVPSGVTGCYVPVAVQIGNIVSNFVTMPIAPSGLPCPDPVTIVDSRVPVTGTISLTRDTTIFPLGYVSTTTTVDSGLAFFGYPILLGSVFLSPLNTCGPPAFTSGLIAPLPLLDAGAAIALTGPHGPKQLLKSRGAYSGQLGGGFDSGATPLYLDAGTYTVSGQGGTDVGPFSQTFTISPPLTWINQGDIIAVDRSAGLDVTWTGGDPNGTVRITSDFSSNGGASSLASFTCIAKNSDHHFTIPAFVLVSLPASEPSTFSGDISLSTISTTRFKAPGLDSGTITSTVAVGKNVTYR